jgi:hypothetical protein
MNEARQCGVDSGIGYPRSSKIETTRRRIAGLTASVTLTLLLLVAAEASAATRYAAPGGNDVAGSECLQTNPCSLFNAASRFAPNSKLEQGDEVVVEPGTYSGAAGELGAEARIVTDARVSIHGIAGQPRPVITVQGGNGTAAFSLDEPGDVLSWLEIVGDELSGPWVLESPSSVIDGVIAISHGVEPCFARAGLIRDSACLSTGPSTSALDVLDGSPKATVELRNVTLLAAGAESHALQARAFDNSEEVSVHGIGVIAKGTQADVFARALSAAPHLPGTGSKVTISLDRSDFAQAKSENDAGEGTTTVTAPGSGTNITAAPQLAADGYHELPGSPTVDAGALDPMDPSLSGSTDIDGEARAMGPAPDIGADELRPPSPVSAPSTTLKKKPPRKTASRKATFTFTSDTPGSRFECELDRKAFKPCHSPVRLRGLKKGRHRFSVRAVGPTGLPDPTPAVFHWRVR